jgi:hypothetical protein
MNRFIGKSQWREFRAAEISGPVALVTSASAAGVSPTDSEAVGSERTRTADPARTSSPKKSLGFPRRGGSGRSKCNSEVGYDSLQKSRSQSLRGTGKCRSTKVGGRDCRIRNARDQGRLHLGKQRIDENGTNPGDISRNRAALMVVAGAAISVSWVVNGSMVDDGSASWTRIDLLRGSCFAHMSKQGERGKFSVISQRIGVIRSIPWEK